MRDDAVYLRHIAECIRRIEENTAAEKAEFLTSHNVQDATLRILANDERSNTTIVRRGKTDATGSRMGKNQCFSECFGS